MVEVIMPKMGDAMEEGTLVEWLKKEGDAVKSGDIIGNIQTDKATVELTAPSSGKLAGIITKAGDTVPVGKAIAAILKEGESLPEGWGNGSAPAAAPPKAESGAKKPEAKKEEPTPAPEPSPQQQQESQAQSERIDARVFASPLARKMAEESGVDLSAIRGTGPNGRIVERDVKAAMEAKPASAPQKPFQGDRLVSLTTLQRITAERTAHSKANVPHYYVTVEVDVDALEALRKQMNAEDEEHKLSLNDFVMKACALALAEQPHINASFEKGQRHEYANINIGVAAAVKDGLTLPVLKNCESKSLRQIATETRDLVAKARDNKLTPNELTGSTFAISNMGMFGVEDFSAIIVEPNGAIVAISAARRVPVVVESADGDSEGGEDIEIRTRMKITGSFDHRIIDGAVGAQFMGVLKKYLESPTRLLS